MLQESVYKSEFGDFNNIHPLVLPLRGMLVVTLVRIEPESVLQLGDLVQFSVSAGICLL